MAYYLVRAKPKDNLSGLHTELEKQAIAQLHPYGQELQQALERARVDSDGYAVWEEQCFCSPPLAQERAVLGAYFEHITTENTKRGAGWDDIHHLPSLWKNA